jgi:hypothetical protein
MEKTTEENLKLAKDQLKLSLETTQEFIDMWTKNYQSTLGKLAQMPAFGPVREKQEKFMKSLPIYPKLYNAWIDSNINLQSVLLEATRRTFERTVEHMNTTGDKSYIDPEGYKEFYKLWIDTYSDTFKEFMKSEHYASDMGKFASVFIDFQKHNREMIEESYLKPNNLPTMTQIEEIHKELYDLRKTVKELVKDMIELSTHMVEKSETSPKEAEIYKEVDQLKTTEPSRITELEQPKIAELEQPKIAERSNVAELPKKVEQPKIAEKEIPKPEKAYPQKKEVHNK